jgi:hypothetical protein
MLSLTLDTAQSEDYSDPMREMPVKPKSISPGIVNIETPAVLTPEEQTEVNRVIEIIKPKTWVKRGFPQSNGPSS